MVRLFRIRAHSARPLAGHSSASDLWCLRMEEGADLRREFVEPLFNQRRSPEFEKFFFTGSELRDLRQDAPALVEKEVRQRAGELFLCLAQGQHGCGIPVRLALL